MPRYVSRKATSQLIDMMDEGLIDPRTLAVACLGYMSEADVADLAHSEGFIEDEDEE